MPTIVVAGASDGIREVLNVTDRRIGDIDPARPHVAPCSRFGLCRP